MNTFPSPLDVGLVDWGDTAKGRGNSGLTCPNTGHNSFDDEPWILKLVEFTRKVLQQDRVRLIGVCFGHQIIGRALDQKVGRSDRGWEVSVTPMQLTEKGRELFGVQEVVSIPSCQHGYEQGAIADLARFPFEGYPPNAPRHRLYLPAFGGAAGPLATLRCAGHV